MRSAGRPGQERRARPDRAPRRPGLHTGRLLPLLWGQTEDWSDWRTYTAGPWYSCPDDRMVIHVTRSDLQRQSGAAAVSCLSMYCTLWVQVPLPTHSG